MNSNIYKLLFPYHNSETTYFSLHNVKKALEYGTDRGVKVGVIDWLFGVDSNSTLYCNFVDLTCSNSELLNSSGHGFQMANALRAIAPECEVVAINAINNNFPNKRIDYFEKAIDWAILNKIDILTNYKRLSKGWKEPIADVHYKEGNEICIFCIDNMTFSVGLCGDLWDDAIVKEVYNTKSDITIWPVYLDYSEEMWNKVKNKNMLNRLFNLTKEHFLLIVFVMAQIEQKEHPHISRME